MSASRRGSQTDQRTQVYYQHLTSPSDSPTKGHAISETIRRSPSRMNQQTNPTTSQQHVHTPTSQPPAKRANRNTASMSQYLNEFGGDVSICQRILCLQQKQVLHIVYDFSHFNFRSIFPVRGHSALFVDLIRDVMFGYQR